ncbi:uncharacterized protein LOC133318117 isoform X2 [Gastrolobium bilobum]|uniref:uncharacterized protein LOC133318117 isoform X2 n=1 Tax=Gastrolobium bilobum TaxID=150636 RepID=UPI002AAF9587|nr:uncharacterized protein LOC133318117 isoform X2 [Gastrolobium bilobum]
MQIFMLCSLSWMAEASQPLRKRVNHTWTNEEDKVLVDCLLEIGQNWKGDNGFKPGFAIHLEKMIHDRIPGCALKSTPHITSRIKLLKRHYNAICEMISLTGGSGFDWNDKHKMIDVDRQIYDDWVKTHPNAKGLYKKPFPYFDMLAPIFGKDMATGQDAVGPEDAAQDVDKEAAINDKCGSIADDMYDQMDDYTQTPFFNPIPEDPTEEGMAHSPVSVSVAKKGKKRGRSEDPVILVVADAMKDLTQSYREGNEVMKEMVKNQGEERALRMTIIEEIKKLEDLTLPQIVKVAMLMGKDNNITNIFMQGGKEERQLVVESLLDNSQ